jgi:hypothetical protein
MPELLTSERPRTTVFDYKEVEAAAQLAEQEANAYVNAVLGVDEQGQQVKYGFRTVEVPRGTYEVSRYYNAKLRTDTTAIDFIPHGYDTPQFFFSMHEGTPGLTPSFNLIAPNRGGENQLDVEQFDLNFSGLQSTEVLERCAQFVAEAVHPSSASGTL